MQVRVLPALCGWRGSEIAYPVTGLGSGREAGAVTITRRTAGVPMAPWEIGVMRIVQRPGPGLIEHVARRVALAMRHVPRTAERRGSGVAVMR